MKREKGLLGFILTVLWIAALTGHVHASANSLALTAEGRGLLFGSDKVTPAIILAAHAEFQAAVTDDPTDAEANFFFSLSRLAVSAVEEGSGAGLETLQDLFLACGVEADWFDKLGGEASDVLPMLYGDYNPPDTLPGGTAVQAFFAGPFLAELDGSLANLSVPDSSFAITLSAAETGDSLIEIDYGDVLTLRSTFHSLKMAIQLTSAYNLDVDLRDIFVLGNSGVFQLQEILDTNPDLLTLQPGGGPAALSSARSSLNESIDAYREAFNFITAEVDHQGDDLLFFGSVEEENQAKLYLNDLSELQSSLAENRPAVKSKQTISMSLVNSNSHSMWISLSLDGAGSLINGNATALDNCDFLFCSSKVTDYERTGDEFEITLEAGGVCPGAATVSGTISGDQVSSGTYMAIDCYHSWGTGESFTGNYFSYPPVTESYDINRLFGNTNKAPLDLRSVMPKFGVYNDPVAGTFPGDPILNGMSIDYPTNKDLAVKAKLRAETDAGSSFFNMPTVSDGAIVVDGNVADWNSQSGTLVFTDFPEDIPPWAPVGTDIREVYLARDSTYLYVGFELEDLVPYQMDGAGFVLETKTQYPPGASVGNTLIGARYDGIQWWTHVSQRHWPGMPPMDVGIPSSEVGIGPNFIEWRVLLADVGSFSGMWLRAYSHLTGPWGTSFYDDNVTQIRLDTATLSGNITCSNCTGSGKFFVKALFGPDPRYGGQLAGTSLETAGNYSLTGVPHIAGAYVYVLHDADNNGITSFGDRWGVSGPISVTAGGATAAVDVSNVIDDSYVMTKPGVYRVFGSNTYIMPEFYFGPWDPNEVVWAPDWVFLGEFAESAEIPTDRFYKHILILWNGDKQFRFDAIQDLTAGTALHTDENGTFIDAGWIASGLSNPGDDGWSVPSNFRGAPDMLYAQTAPQPGFSLMEMPADSLDDAAPRQLALTLVSPFTIEANLMNVNANGSQQTFYMVDLYGYSGSLPGDVDQLTISGPGVDLTYSKADIAAGKDGLAYYPAWNEFFLALPGAPTPGHYTFTVTTDGVTQTYTDIQYVNRTLPLVDTAGASPAADQEMVSMTPTFSWPGVTADGPVLSYRLEINDMAGNRVFASPRVPGMLDHTLPVGALQPGQSYVYRIRVIDNDQWLDVQNRSHTAWIPFTTAAALTHATQPVFDTQTFYATTWTTANGPGLVCAATVNDADGIASDGSSHVINVLFPGAATPETLDFDGAQNATTASYSKYFPGDALPGNYLFTVTDPDWRTNTLTDNLVVNAIEPVMEPTLKPSLINPVVESLSATFDNVVVDGVPYEDFSGYATLADVPPSKWQIAGNGTASISGGKLVMASGATVGRNTQVALLPNANAINSVQADITVTAASSDIVPRARIAGGWFHDGIADVWAGLNVFNDRVTYYVNHDHFDETVYWTKLDRGVLKTIAPGQTVVASISWDPATKALTFSADGATATYTSPAAAVGPPKMDKQKGLWVRTHLITSVTPRFSWDGVANAARYRVRIYNYDKTRTLHRGYVDDGSNVYQVPAGLLRPSSFYTFRLEAWDAVDAADVDNFSKIPASNGMNYQFYTGLPGDVNGNLSVELDDAVQTFKVISGDASPTVHSHADANGDNKIGMEDAAFILQDISDLR